MDPIKGYRELTPHEVRTINDIKTVGELVGQMVEHLRTNPDGMDLDPRWIAEAKTDLQKGFMSLVRAVAQPTSF